MSRAPNRRAFLAGSLAVPTAAALAATPVDRVKEATDALGAAMEARHGGQWIVHVDHDAGFILIMPDREARAILDGRKGGAA